MKHKINLRSLVGDFAENKETAKKIRLEEIMPSLSRGDEVRIDFLGVSGATQSFIHALISDPIREFSDVAYDKLVYENVNDEIKEIIGIVYRYMQESIS